MKAGKIRRSIQRFEDHSSDLTSADMNSFEDRLNLLISYCKSDTFFQQIDKQLIENKSVDFDTWYKSNSRGKVKFPTNIDERLSIMYELLCRINSQEISYLSFCCEFLVVGSSQIDAHIYALNEIVSEPLFRELGYRLEEIEEELPSDNSDEVTSSIFQIIHHADNVIQQNIIGDGNNQNASITNTNNELNKLFSDLKAEIRTLEISQEEIQENIESIVACEDLAQQETPKKGVIKRLLSTLPSLGSVASIASAIIAVL
ncbi:MAG: hypothetical protein JKY55_11470 [Aliivibrio sp.]|uniref:hypothetical protein n=1 Tax=Aliivibrio sp. TaxID=1872443 RepID=UPI001A37DE5B|nr:hypothetical protein [Aliivibrio sp.]